MNSQKSTGRTPLLLGVLVLVLYCAEVRAQEGGQLKSVSIHSLEGTNRNRPDLSDSVIRIRCTHMSTVLVDRNGDTVEVVSGVDRLRRTQYVYNDRREIDSIITRVNGKVDEFRVCERSPDRRVLSVREYDKRGWLVKTIERRYDSTKRLQSRIKSNEREQLTWYEEYLHDALGWPVQVLEVKCRTDTVEHRCDTTWTHPSFDERGILVAITVERNGARAELARWEYDSLTRRRTSRSETPTDTMVMVFDEHMQNISIESIQWGTDPISNGAKRRKYQLITFTTTESGEVAAGAVHKRKERNNGAVEESFTHLFFVREYW